MRDYLPEDEFFAYKDKVIDQLRKSETVGQHSEQEQRAIIRDVDLLLQVSYHYYDVDHVSKFTPAGLEDFTLQHLPRKMIGDPGLLKIMGLSYVAFTKWLRDEHLVKNGAKLVERMEKVAPKMGR